MEKLTKQDPDFYRKIANMRKVKSGGKYFKDREAAKSANIKSVEARLRNTRERKLAEEATKEEHVQG